MRHAPLIVEIDELVQSACGRARCISRTVAPNIVDVVELRTQNPQPLPSCRRSPGLLIDRGNAGDEGDWRKLAREILCAGGSGDEEKRTEEAAKIDPD